MRLKIRVQRLLAMTSLLGMVSLVTVLPDAWAQPERELLAAGHLDEAITNLRGRVQANPKDADGFELLCRAYSSVEQWDDAAAACERAAGLSPESSDYQMWLGRAYGEKAQRASVFSQLGLARKVREAFERSVQLDPANADARSALAEFYMEAPGIVGGGSDKARAQADAVAATDPGLAHYIRGRLAERDKNTAGAEQEYKSAALAAKDPAEQWLNLALFYYRQKRWTEFDDAIAKTSANATGKHAGVLVEAATLLGRANRNLPLATQMVRRFLNGKVGDDEHPIFAAHWVLGRLLEKQGDKTGATAEYKAAVALAHGYSQARESLAKLGGN